MRASGWRNIGWRKVHGSQRLHICNMCCVLICVKATSCCATRSRADCYATSMCLDRIEMLGFLSSLMAPRLSAVMSIVSTVNGGRSLACAATTLPWSRQRRLSVAEAARVGSSLVVPHWKTYRTCTVGFHSAFGCLVYGGHFPPTWQWVSEVFWDLELFRDPLRHLARRLITPLPPMV